MLPRWDHQDRSLAFFQSTPVAFDNSDPGTGKTRSQIDNYNLRPRPKGRWLIIAPKTLMATAWAADIQEFAPNLTVSLAYADNREEAFAMPTDVVVLNTDGVKFLADKKNQRFLHDFDHLTIDEYTTFKHPTSKRSKAAAAIRKFFKYRYLLSGTPNPNSLMELWHPALILDDGQRLGTSYYGLRNKIQIPRQIGPRPEHLKWEDKPGMAEVVDQILADVTIRHVFEEVMTHVPPNHRDFRDFELSRKALKAYKQLEDEFIMVAEDGQVVDAVHAATLRNKLLQIASGAVYARPGEEESPYTVIDSSRYELIGEIVENRDHSVVFFNWRHQRELLQAEFDKRGLRHALIDGSVKDKDRPEIVSAYQRGEYDTILLHPRTGAHGLTLTMGDTTVFSSPIYEADLMEQAIRRIYRGTQDKVTNTLFIRAKGTVEELVYNRLFDKAAAMTDLLQLMADRKK